MFTKEEQDNLKRLLLLAISLSSVTPKMIKKASLHFKISENTEEWPVEDIVLLKRLFGFILSNSSLKYGISKKKNKPEGFPHIDDWNNLKRGECDLQDYDDVFAFLKKKDETGKIITPIKIIRRKSNWINPQTTRESLESLRTTQHKKDSTDYEHGITDT